MTTQSEQMNCEYCGQEIIRGKTGHCLNVPFDTPVLWLNYQNACGDYIDFITSDEVTSSLMKGHDTYNRPFIVLKVDVYDPDDKLKDTRIETFFQRYTDDKFLWMGCGHATNLFISTIGGMKSCQFNLLADLIAGKKVVVKECCYPDDGINVGDKLCLHTST